MKSRALLFTMLCFLGAVLVLQAAQQQPAGGRGGNRGGGGADGNAGGGRGAQQPFTPVPSEEKQVTIAEIPGVIAANARWEKVWQGAENADGIVGMPDGALLFAQEQSSTIRKLDANGFDSAYVRDTNGTGSIAIDAQGRMIAVQRTCTDPGRAPLPCNDPTKVAIIFPVKDRKVLADNFNGMSMGRLNDLTVSKNGTVYFNGGGTFYLKPGGKVMEIGEDIGSNGIMLSPDEKTLYMTNMGGLLAFDIQPDGTPANRREFVKFPTNGGDGLAVDSMGRIYATTQAGGVVVVSPEGKVLGTIPTPRSVITVAFAGPDKKTLYVVGSGGNSPNGGEFTLAPGYRNNAKTIYKIQMTSQGFRGRWK